MDDDDQPLSFVVPVKAKFKIGQRVYAKTVTNPGTGTIIKSPTRAQLAKLVGPRANIKLRPNEYWVQMDDKTHYHDGKVIVESYFLKLV